MSRVAGWMRLTSDRNGVVKVNSKHEIGSATIGASAVLAMGAFAVVLTGMSAAQTLNLRSAGPHDDVGDHDGRDHHGNRAPEAPETTAAVPPITTEPTTVATVTP